MILKKHRFTEETGFDSELDLSLDSESTVCFLFGAPTFARHIKVFDDLKRDFPKTIFVGCSGSGEIFDHRVYDKSISIAFIKFERTRIKLAIKPIESMSKSYQIGQDLTQELNAHDLTGMFVLSDGLQINGSELVNGLSKELSSNVIVTGGLAGDGSDFKETWIIHNHRPRKGYVSVLAFYGKNIQIGHASRAGWNLFGPERLVTRSDANILFELDGKPALSLYKEYLGELAKQLPASALLFPLQIRTDAKDENRIVRTILAVNETDQSMTFAGNIPQGALAQLMRANFESLIEGASTAAESLKREMSGNQVPTLVISISCVGRRLVLGERTEEEIEAILESLPPGTQQIGYYSYGEISPAKKGLSCELHNQTMTLTSISEKATDESTS